MKRILYLICLSICLLIPGRSMAQYAYEIKGVEEIVREIHSVDNYGGNIGTYVDDEKKTGQILFFVGTGFVVMNAAALCVNAFGDKKLTDGNSAGTAAMGLVFGFAMQEIGIYHWVKGNDRAAYYDGRKRQKIDNHY